MIIVIGGQKGGTGKSTMATNLAVWFKNQDIDIILVDGNPGQGSVAEWAEIRDENEGLQSIPCVEKSGNLSKVLTELSTRYEIVVVDTGGQDSKEFRGALMSADLLITPIEPAPNSIKTLGYVSDLVSNSRVFNPNLVAKVVINRAPTHHQINLIKETKDIVDEIQELELLKTVIHSRTSHVYASGMGAGVLELDSSAKKAAQEINSMAKELFTHD